MRRNIERFNSTLQEDPAQIYSEILPNSIVHKEEVFQNAWVKFFPVVVTGGPRRFWGPGGACSSFEDSPHRAPGTSERKPQCTPTFTLGHLSSSLEAGAHKWSA